MRTSTFCVVAGVVLGSGLVNAQSVTSLDPSMCIQGSPLKTFSACNYMYSHISYCDSPSVATGAPAVACFCNQKLFNAYYDCESEQRLCYGGTDLDDSMQQNIDLWHSACDKKITFMPTTPVVSTLTSTYDDSFCATAVEQACQSGLDAQQSCSIQYTGQAWSSCFCQPQLLSLQYTCDYLGNVSCLQTTAALTDMAAYRFCDNAASVLGTGSGNLPSSVSASSTASQTVVLPSASTASSVISTSILTTKPALPGSSTTAPGPASTSSLASSGLATLKDSFITVVLAFVSLVAVTYT